MYICVYMYMHNMNALYKIIMLKYIHAIKLDNATLDCIV